MISVNLASQYLSAHYGFVFLHFSALLFTLIIVVAFSRLSIHLFQIKALKLNLFEICVGHVAETYKNTGCLVLQAFAEY